MPGCLRCGDSKEGMVDIVVVWGDRGDRDGSTYLDTLNFRICVGKCHDDFCQSSIAWGENEEQALSAANKTPADVGWEIEDIDRGRYAAGNDYWEALEDIEMHVEAAMGEL